LSRDKEYKYFDALVFMQTKISEAEEIGRLARILQIEKQEDFEQFRQKVLSLPLEQRIKEGYSWYPLQVVQQGYTYGERAFVVLEKVGGLIPRQFRSGMTVNLFTRQPGVHRPEESGVVHYMNKNRMNVILNSRDLPEWLGMGQIGLDLLFDETTYLEMEKALARVAKAKGDRLAELRSIILGRQAPLFREVDQPVQIPSLNPSQNLAVNEILEARDVAVVHGPPGTGKTTTLVQAVKLLCQTEQTVLVTAPSNTAVDLLTERLAEAGLAVVRIGNISRVDESIMRHTLDMQLAAHPESKNIKKVKIQAAEARRNARKYKRRFGREEYDERQRLFQEARELSAWANQLEERLIDQVLDSANVITCTLVGAAHRLLDKRKFRTVVIDEAAQALEPATWIPLLRASCLVLTGDPFQLPPTVKSMEAQKEGLGVTMIEKCLKQMGRTSLLNVQYRMHRHIMGFSNKRFYGGELQAADEVRDHLLPIGDNAPVIFIDTAGCGFEEEVSEEFQSRANPKEFHILCEHLYQLSESFDKAPPPIALISPYKEQVILMKKQVEADPRLAELPLTINTIDGFQGQEREIVYISLVRSNEKGEIGFLNDYRRMNVAMTRARKQLIVIGDSATIGGHAFYLDFLEYCEKVGAYRTAWEYLR
jgi:ATP-dependent RNA/DNA helicase IGHMBP2